MLLVVISAALIRAGVAADVSYAPNSIRFGEVTASNAEGVWPALAVMVSAFFSLNLLLAAFNLLPFPPLDGSGAVPILLSDNAARKYQAFMWSNRAFGLLGRRRMAVVQVRVDRSLRRREPAVPGHAVGGTLTIVRAGSPSDHVRRARNRSRLRPGPNADSASAIGSDGCQVQPFLFRASSARPHATWGERRWPAADDGRSRSRQPRRDKLGNATERIPLDILVDRQLRSARHRFSGRGATSGHAHCASGYVLHARVASGTTGQPRHLQDR